MKVRNIGSVCNINHSTLSKKGETRTKEEKTTTKSYNYNPAVFKINAVNLTPAKDLRGKKAFIQSALKEVITPFLEKYEPFSDRALKLHEDSEKVLSVNRVFSKQFSAMRLNPVDIDQTGVLKKNLSFNLLYRNRLKSFEQNYKYAKENFGDDKTLMAKLNELEPSIKFKSKPIERMNLLYGKYKKMIKSVNKNIANHTLIPDDAHHYKVLNINKSYDIGLMYDTGAISDATIFRSNANEFLSGKNTSNNLYQWLREQLSNIQPKITRFETVAHSRLKLLENGEELFEKNKFTEKEAQKAYSNSIQAIHNVAQRYISNLEDETVRKNSLKWNSKDTPKVMAQFEEQEWALAYAETAIKEAQTRNPGVW